LTAILFGRSREPDLLHELERSGVEDVDGLVLLVGAVVIEAVGVHGEVVRVRTTLDEAHHLIDGRVDDVVEIAGVVALQDAHGDALIGIEAGHTLRRDRRGEQGAA
jgi:hypothetical protein